MKKISVFCIWRDSEAHIDQALSQLENLELLDGYSFSYFFYENDSKDNTAQILNEWLKGRKGALQSEKLDAQKFGSVTDPARMKLLCYCRNKSKLLAGENNSDLCLIFDSDVHFNNENFISQIRVFDEREDAVMVTPNVRQNIPDYVFGSKEDSYYDIYPFRDKHGGTGMYFSDCPSFKEEDRLLWERGIPIECYAAFGGFALVKTEAFNKTKWSADIHCDHVNMCFELNRYGKIYIHPKSIVRVDVGIDKINIMACKKIAEQQKQIYLQYYVK